MLLMNSVTVPCVITKPMTSWFLISSRMQSIQNLGLAIVGLFVGYIVDSRGYLMLETFFLAMLSCTW